MRFDMRWFWTLCVLGWMGVCPTLASAQTMEAFGSRALGMGGAFVAVASDASATWWNPAGLASGPFVDVSLGLTNTDLRAVDPSAPERVIGFALMTPPAGVSFYRFRVTDIRPVGSIDEAAADREQRQAGVPVGVLTANQVGVTLLHTVASGIHVGTTLKYTRGIVSSSGVSKSGAGNAIDVDLGALVTHGAVRAGILVRHLTSPGFGDGAARIELPIQGRAGVAFDGEAIGRAPFVLSMDVDVNRIEASNGDRRVLALGAERWVRGKRLGFRGGARFNTAGRKERAATAGVSVAVKPAMYVEAHAARGGTVDDRGWGVGARITF
jgi:hypothetical protein